LLALKFAGSVLIETASLGPSVTPLNRHAGSSTLQVIVFCAEILTKSKHEIPTDNKIIFIFSFDFQVQSLRNSLHKLTENGF
jgi:hypothetical protein